jgi:hypothetical protein
MSLYKINRQTSQTANQGRLLGISLATFSGHLHRQLEIKVSLICSSSLSSMDVKSSSSRSSPLSASFLAESSSSPSESTAPKLRERAESLRLLFIWTNHHCRRRRRTRTSSLWRHHTPQLVLETIFKGHNVQISGKASSTLPGPYHRLALAVQSRLK